MRFQELTDPAHWTNVSCFIRRDTVWCFRTRCGLALHVRAVCDTPICALRDTILTFFSLARVAGNLVVVAGEGLSHGMRYRGLYCLYCLIYSELTHYCCGKQLAK